MLPYRQHGSEELAEGYATAAKLAEERRDYCAQAGRAGEAKQWGKIVTYCSVMAKYRMVDEPNPRVRYEIPMPPDTIQALIARDAIQEDGWFRQWDGESIPPDDPRRPMKPERRFALAVAMQSLDDRERVAAIMHWGWRLDPDLIAEAMEMDEATLKRTLDRVKRKFTRINREDTYLVSLMQRADKFIDRTRTKRII